MKRLYSVNKQRKSTPCKFKNCISFCEFKDIAKKCSKKVNHIKLIKVEDASIYCIVHNNGNIPDWNFTADFNDWGHITGKFWLDLEKVDSTFVNSYVKMVSEHIINLIFEKGIVLKSLSNYVNNNEDLGINDDDFSYINKKNLFPNLLKKPEVVKTGFSSKELRGEHIYAVISILKSKGFKNIKSNKVLIDAQEEDNFPYEVSKVLISGKDTFEEDSSFYENEEVIINYYI